MSFDYSTIYPNESLRYWSTRYPENVKWNFHELMLSKLRQAESNHAYNSTLMFPLRPDSMLDGTPFSFYASVAEKKIYVPISAIKFIDDVSIAAAWLERNNYSLETLIDYISILKYGVNRFPPGQVPDPIKALHVPEKAYEQDQWVDELSQKILKSIMVWILGHELGHIIYQHPPYKDVSFSTSQQCEKEADAFATDMFRRIGTAPAGMVILFTLFTSFFRHRGDFSNDTDWEKYLRDSTHPVSNERLLLIANEFLKNPETFVGAEPNVFKATQLVTTIGKEAKKIAEIMNSSKMQIFLTARALSVDINSLHPRRIGENPITEEGYSDQYFTDMPFSGIYTGNYKRFLTDGSEETLNATVVFYRKGTRITGRFSFGVGVGELNGYMENHELNYNWIWGGANGKGKLKANDNKSFKGTWGFVTPFGGGTWEGIKTTQGINKFNH